MKALLTKNPVNERHLKIGLLISGIGGIAFAITYPYGFTDGGFVVFLIGSVGWVLPELLFGGEEGA